MARSSKRLKRGLSMTPAGGGGHESLSADRLVAAVSGNLRVIEGR